MRERNPETRTDVEYPFERRDEHGRVMEVMSHPSMYEIKFIYQKAKKS